jgi:hypothetical protein
MAVQRKGNSKDVPLLSPDEVRHLAGDVDDETASAILRMRPTLGELDLAVAYARGEGSLVDREGHPLSGPVAQIQDILTTEEQSAELQR